MHGAHVNCLIAQLRRFRVIHRSDYHVRIVTSWSVIADHTLIAHSVISGQRPVTGRRCNTDRFIAAYFCQWRIRCHPSLVRQFWGRCPLLSVTRQAISGQVPIAVRHSSGNFEAGAHFRPSLVRQFRGKCPLPSVTRQAILGQVPIAVHCSSGDFWGKCPLLGGAIFTRLIASRVVIAGAHVRGQFCLQCWPHVRSSSPFSSTTIRFGEIDVCFSVKGSFLREDSGPVFVYVVATSFIVNRIPYRHPSGTNPAVPNTDPAQPPGPFWRVYL